VAELNRCWLGHPLPRPLLEKIKEAQMQIRRRAGSDAVRWLSPGEVALLLVSLGEIADASVLRVQGIVDQVAKRHAPLSLRLEGAGGSPNVTMPKSAWIGVHGDTDRLKALREDLAVCAQQFVTAVDEKPFEPLIEVGVLRKFDDRARTDMGRAIKMSGIGALGEFTVGAVHVLASRATSAGPALVSIAETPLVE
jgi:2'-5' RNA ligase